MTNYIVASGPGSWRVRILAQLATDVTALEQRVVDAGGLADIAGSLRLVRSEIEQAGRMTGGESSAT